MSRIDYITIALVAICLCALVYIFIRIGNLNNPTDQNSPSITPQETIETSSVAKTDTLSSNTTDSLPKEKIDTITTEKENPTEKKSVEILPAKTDLAYMVVAASFNTTELAEEERQRLIRLGYTQAEIGYFNKGTYAAVIVERFANYAKAQTLAKQLQQKHKIDAYVHRKRTTSE